MSTERAERFLIIGGGIAAVAAAEEIRRLNATASIVMISEEAALPYYRPALSKELFLPRTRERFSLHPPEWYSRRGIFLLSGRQVTRLIPRAKQLELAGGEVLGYDKCILATGAQSMLPSLKGRTLRGVFTLRTVRDLDAIAGYIRPDMRAVVLGSGTVGLEAAWQLYLGGCHVTVLERGEQLMGGRIDEVLSRRIHALANSRGVEIRTRAAVSRLEGTEQVERVILPGQYLRADVVLLCCGSRPRAELAEGAGLESRGSIAVNARMMTGKYGIYACGDCACMGEESYGSAASAEEMGRYAGRNAAGEDALFRPRPMLIQMEAFGTRLFAAGDCRGQSDGRTEHSGETGEEIFLYFREDRLCGFALLGDTSDAAAWMRRLERGTFCTSV